jgi:hypothetical protein
MKTGQVVLIVVGGVLAYAIYTVGQSVNATDSAIDNVSNAVTSTPAAIGSAFSTGLNSLITAPATFIQSFINLLSSNTSASNPISSSTGVSYTPLAGDDYQDTNQLFSGFQNQNSYPTGLDNV